jgi:hypothetical protein
MRLFLLLGVLLLRVLLFEGAVAARTPTPVEVINAASHEILCYAPVFRDLAQAQALRRAVVERQVKVIVLTEPEAAFENASYLPSLKLVGVRLFVARVPQGQRGLLIADQRIAITGLGVGRQTLPYEAGFKLEQSRNIPSLKAWLMKAVRNAKPFLLQDFLGR